MRIHRWLLAALVMLAFVASFLYGAYFIGKDHKRALALTLSEPLRQSLGHWCKSFGCGYSDVSGRTEVSCLDYVGPQSSSMVLLVLGQSNSANTAKGEYLARGKIANFNPRDNKCYKAEDPLLGAFGTRGSAWNRVSDLLIDSEVYDQVLIISLGVSSSKIKQWGVDGAYGEITKKVINQLRQMNVHISHVAWHQGESDVLESKESYMKSFESVEKNLRDSGMSAPIFVSVASICKDFGSDEIRTAQLEIPDLYPQVFRGPNTDLLDRYSDRYDFCHFSESGINKYSNLWFDTFKDFEDSKAGYYLN